MIHAITDSFNKRGYASEVGAIQRRFQTDHCLCDEAANTFFCDTMATKDVDEETNLQEPASPKTEGCVASLEPPSLLTNIFFDILNRSLFDDWC